MKKITLLFFTFLLFQTTVKSQIPVKKSSTIHDLSAISDSRFGNGINYMLHYNTDTGRVAEIQWYLSEKVNGNWVQYRGEVRGFWAHEKQFTPWPGNIYMRPSGEILNNLLMKNLKPNTEYQFTIEKFQRDIRDWKDHIGPGNKIWYSISISHYFKTPPTCKAPTGLKTMYVNPGGAGFKWNKVSAGSYYEVAILSSGKWSTSTTHRTYYKLRTMPGKAYAVVVRTHCGGVKPNIKPSAWSSPIRFTTPRTLSSKAASSKANFKKDLILGESTIYPNPNNGNFTIKFKTNDEFTKHVTIFNMMGSKVFYKESNNSSEESIDLGKLSNGMYKIQISTQGNDDIEYKTLIIK